jgi:ribulose-5-phosphate 4-epimerase/fuculose-1-phosphate aldolase
MTLAAYNLVEVESLQGKVSEAEWAARVELAAAFRIAVSRDWNNSTANHMTARVPDQPECFLMNAADFAWDEVTASNLLKLDMDGNPDRFVAAFDNLEPPTPRLLLEN